LHLLVFFFAALICHGRLAGRRPSVAHLTEFYLWISVGGVIGGLFNTLLAPAIFTHTVEYPLGLVAASLLRPQPEFAAGRERRPVRSVFVVVAVFALAFALVYSRVSNLPGQTLAVVTVLLGSLAFFGAVNWRRPVYSGIAAGAILLFGAAGEARDRDVIWVERNFFGVHTVQNTADGLYRQLFNGTTMHGMQARSPAQRVDPLGYYHREGPFGQIFEALSGRRPAPRVAVLGLGAGSMGCYAQSGHGWTFYDIDPAVVRIARNPRFFTLLQDCAPEAAVILGDARLALKGAQYRSYDLIALDVFSSDAIPMHLLTREAMALYLSKLAPGGILALHVSNRHLDLEPVVGALATDAGLTALIRKDTDQQSRGWPAGKAPSVWIVIGRGVADLGALSSDAQWSPLLVPGGFTVWTDDFSNLLAAIKWR
jgi:SAM-dependent methyltransferase